MENAYRRVDLTADQRRSIRERDKQSCQYPLEHDCRGNLHCHHITPVRWAKTQLNWTDRQIAHPENILTICEGIHIGAGGIHDDMEQARLSYRVNKRSYAEAFALRAKLIAEGAPYWNINFMYEMHLKATLNTHIAMVEGWEYPINSVPKPRTTKPRRK